MNAAYLIYFGAFATTTRHSERITNAALFLRLLTQRIPAFIAIIRPNLDELKNDYSRTNNLALHQDNQRT